MKMSESGDEEKRDGWERRERDGGSVKNSFVVIGRAPRCTQSRSSAASDEYKRQVRERSIKLATLKLSPTAVAGLLSSRRIRPVSMP